MLKKNRDALEKVIILLHSLTTYHLLFRATKIPFNLSNGSIAELQAGTKLKSVSIPRSMTAFDNSMCRWIDAAT
jgi:hypothetical protein